MTDSTHFLTVKDMASALQARQISAVELAQLHLDRIALTESALGSYITVTGEAALTQAREADDRLADGTAGPLTGVPMQLKDNISTKGIITSCASKMLEHYVPPFDATVTRRLKEAGAILMGKGNMDEFAMGSSTENSAVQRTVNPWGLDRVPGGSSGGPAVAVAAGQAAFSLGSDTGGSIRQPAALCGIVGLKPTYGLVSRYGLVAFASSLDQIGPLTRTVVDSALVLNSVAGHDPFDSTSIAIELPDYTQGIDQGVQGLRIGVAKEYFGEGIDPRVEGKVRDAILRLEELGAVVEEVSLPLTRSALAVYYILAPAECSANLARYDGVIYGHSDQETSGMWNALGSTRQQGFGEEVKRRVLLGTYTLSAGYYDAFYRKAQQVRTLIRREFDDAFGRFDLLVAPTSPTVAFKLGERTEDPVQMYSSDICTLPVNIAGIPAISVPCGFVDDLPVSIQMMGPHLSEPTLFRAAYAYEQSMDWHMHHPQL